MREADVGFRYSWVGRSEVLGEKKEEWGWLVGIIV